MAMQAAFHQISFLKVFVSQRKCLQANWEHGQPPAIKRQRQDAGALTPLNSPALANQPQEGGSHSSGMWHSPGMQGSGQIEEEEEGLCQNHFTWGCSKPVSLSKR